MNSLIVLPEEVNGSIATLTAERALYAFDTHELREGLKIKVGELFGLTGEGVVQQASREKVTVRLILSTSPISRNSVHLVIAVPRPQTVKKILHYGAMFGVTQIDFVQAGNTEKSYLQSHSLTGVRQQREIIKGLEQVGDTIPPKVEIHRSLQGVLSSLPKYPAVRLVASTEPPTETLMVWQKEISEGKPTVIAIGPELGWQAAELALFNQEGFSPLTLGNRVLRVEVAFAAFLGQFELLRTPRA